MRPPIEKPGWLHLFLMQHGSLATMVLLSATVLCLVWLYRVIRHRHIYPVLGTVSVTMAILAYLLCDWHHISLNITMRDPQAVRVDCENLLVLYKSTYPHVDRDMYISGAQLPPSFLRLKAKWALVSDNTVQIRFHDEPGNSWAYLYDPKRIYMSNAWLREEHMARDTWYRDIYEIKVHVWSGIE